MVFPVARSIADRYGFKDFPHSSHRLLLQWVGDTPQKVLDVGTATGFLGQALTRAGHTVVGIESDPDAAQLARSHYAALHLVDLQNLRLLPEAPFAAVLVGDVLEHMADPAAALHRLVAQLTPTGSVIVSVPNVAFVQVRLALLAGRFEYRKRGILDDTHVRFFTRRTFRRLLVAEGLRVVRMVGVPPPLPLLAPAFARWPARFLLELASLAARVWPTLFAYQFVAEATR